MSFLDELAGLPNKTLIANRIKIAQIADKAEKAFAKRDESAYFTAMDLTMQLPGEIFAPVIAAASAYCAPHLLISIDDEIQQRKDNGSLSESEIADAQAQMAEFIKKVDELERLKNELDATKNPFGDDCDNYDDRLD